MMPLKNKNYRKSYNNTSPPSCPRQPFSSIFTKKTTTIIIITTKKDLHPFPVLYGLRITSCIYPHQHLSSLHVHTIKLLHICGLISDKMRHFSDKMLSFCDKIMTKQRKCRLKIVRRRRKSEDHTCHGHIQV